MASTNSFRELVTKHSVSDLVQAGRDILVISSQEDTTAAFKKLVDKGVLSAPVWDPASKKYVGFLDVKDLVSFVVFREEEKERDHIRKTSSANSLLELPKADMRQYFDVAARMYATPSAGINVTYLARRHAFHPVHPEAPLAEVVRVLGTSGVHRVPVVDSTTGKVVDIISQSTFVQFLAKNRGEIADLLGETIEQSQLGSRPVLPVNATDSALHTFQVMSKHNRSGVAVVEADTGRFVGNTSGTDLKLLLADLDRTQQLLGGSILDFLSAVRQSDVGDTKYPAIAISRTTTIGGVLDKLAATRIHRLFVADDAHGYKPEAVISITDMLRYLSDKNVDASMAQPLISVTSE